MASRALTGTLDLTRVGSIDLPEIKIMVRSGYSRGYSCDRNVTEEAEAKVNQCYRQAIVEVLFSDPAFKAYFDGDDVPTSLLRPKTNVNVNFSNGLITIRRGEEITTRQIHEFDLPEESIEKFASLSKVAIEAFNGATGRSLNSYTQGRILPDRHIGGAHSPLITAPRHPESFDRSELPLTNINQISENLARDLAQCRSPKEAKMLLSQTRYATVMMHEYQAIFSSLQDRYSIALARIDHQIEKESDPAKLRMLQVSRKPMQEKLDRVKNMKTHIDHLDCYAIYNVLKANAHLHESASREGFILGPSDSKRVEAVHQLYQTTLEDHKATNVSGWFWKTTIDNNSEKREQYAKKVSHMLFTTLHDKYPHVGRNEQQTFEEAIVLSASKLMTSLGRRDAGFLGLPQGLFSELGPEVEHYLKEAHEKATAYAFEHAKEALTESTELEDGEEVVSFAMKGGS
ncbi:MAG: hypothetical protein K9M13_01115, partial [Simkaniaceae bacterium]|nr:hypothetical protein [Simkaniaceae bacterium]